MFPQTKGELRRCYGRPAVALLVFTLTVYVAGFALLLAAERQRWWGLDRTLGIEVLNTLVLLPVGALVLRLVLRRSPVPRLAKAPPPSVGSLVEVFLLAAGLLSIGSILTRFALAGTNTTDYANQFLDQQPLWMSLVFTVALGPVMEELIFRRLLLDRLLYLGDVSALLLSSLFFGLFHTNLYQFLYAVLAGLVLGYVRIMSGRLVYSIGLHACLNLCFGVLVDYASRGACEAAVLVCIASVPVILIYRRPWEQLYAGPLHWFTPGDKLGACLSSPAFWICVGTHLGLALLFIRG